MCYDRAEVKAYYEFQIAKGEWDNFGGRTNLDHVCSLAQIPDVNSGRVLDIGCGDGDVAQALSGRGIAWSQYLGVDAIPALVDQFNSRKLDGARAIVDEVTDLTQLAANSVDLVLCLFLLQDICRTEGESVVETVVRVLTPAGHAIWSLAVTSQTSFSSRGGAQALKAIGSPDKGRFTWGESDFLDTLRTRGLIEQARREDPSATHATLSELYLLTKRSLR